MHRMLHDIRLLACAEDLPQDVGAPKAACIRARHLGESLKDPPGGRLVLTPEDFHDPASLAPSDCVGHAP